MLEHRRELATLSLSTIYIILHYVWGSAYENGTWLMECVLRQRGLSIITTLYYSSSKAS